MIQEKQVELLALLMIIGSYEGNEPIEYEGKLYDIVKMRERGCELMQEFLKNYEINNKVWGSLLRKNLLRNLPKSIITSMIILSLIILIADIKSV